MPMKRALPPVNWPTFEKKVEVVEVVEEIEIFDPEAGKPTDNPFAEEIIPDAPEDITFINNYEDMKVVELKDILKQRGLPTKGNKQDLILKLEESDAEATEQVSTAEENEDPAWVQAAASVLEEGVSKYEGTPSENNGAEEV